MEADLSELLTDAQLLSCRPDHSFKVMMKSLFKHRHYLTPSVQRSQIASPVWPTQHQDMVQSCAEAIALGAVESARRRRRPRKTLRHRVWVQTTVSGHLLIPAQLNKRDSWTPRGSGAFRGYLDALGVRGEGAVWAVGREGSGQGVVIACHGPGNWLALSSRALLWWVSIKLYLLHQKSPVWHFCHIFYSITPEESFLVCKHKCIPDGSCRVTYTGPLQHWMSKSPRTTLHLQHI